MVETSDQEKIQELEAEVKFWKDNNMEELLSRAAEKVIDLEDILEKTYMFLSMVHQDNLSQIDRDSCNSIIRQLTKVKNNLTMRKHIVYSVRDTYK